MAGMMTSLLLLLLAGVTVGRVVDLQKRIIGGHTCAATERLYHVKVISNFQGEVYHCGGSLINKQWILTAAHCVKMGVESVTVNLGVNGDGQRETCVIDDIRRKTTLLDTKYVPHDIVLLKLPESVTGYAFVDLPECGTPPQIGQTVEIAGHGATQVKRDGTRGNFPDSNTLQCAYTNVAACTQGDLNSGFYSTPETLFCFKDKNVDISHGDSGGGVVFENKIYGVISFVGDDQVAFQHPAGAVKVCEYIDWIQEMMGTVWTCTTCG
ncbi:cationic trypsin-like isoform X1 [Trematomus bernacchii]|uniref:cationic trypsin-like isoform X1 n=1 Tax=Trematomus bernacchii TaxID=40690 RepID=UPI00146F168C|nr:cationic trypsin-like isoform X1 [Trematomus bernacchii]